MKYKYLIIFLATLGLNGCTHKLMRGSVAMKTSNSRGHVCLGDKEVKLGDRVTAYQSVCTRGVRGEGRVAACEKREIGQGTVEELINEHYSVVKFDDGVKFDEGTLVEVR